MVPSGLTGAQRVHQHQMERGPDEGEVVVAAIPDQDVGLRFGATQNRFVVDTGVDDHPRHQMRLVFLALLYGAVGRVEVLDRREALFGHGAEVAIGHRVADRRDAQTLRPQMTGQPTRRL